MPGSLDVWTPVLRKPSRHAVRIAGQAVVITALVGGTAAYAFADTTVDLSVDGDRQQVSAFGSSVADVLDAAGVELGEHDVVSPAVDATLADGDDVQVELATQVNLTVDGQTATHWTTARTVGDALEDLAVRDENAQVSASRGTPLGRDSIDLVVDNPKDVQVVVDGVVLPVVSQAGTVGDVLAQAGVALGPLDKISVPVAAPVVDGLHVTVTRVATAALVEELDVAFATEERPSDQLFEGERDVEQTGEVGTQTITYEQVTAGGAEIARRVVSDQVTAQPVTQVVLVGTKPRPAEPEESEPAGDDAPAVADGSVWDRLAECESGGNWQANTGNGYYGGVQFSAQTWRSVGGSGLPHENSREEQINRASILQAQSGWGQWPACSRKLGLR